MGWVYMFFGGQTHSHIQERKCVLAVSFRLFSLILQVGTAHPRSKRICSEQVDTDPHQAN